MPANTPILALPYPVPGDTVDVPRDVQALAVKLDSFSAISPPLVAALPGSPTNGQEVLFQTAAMATSGWIWRLRYRSASASAYKWEFIGGAALFSADPSNRPVTTNIYDPGSSLVAAQVPLAGEYACEAGANMYNTANSQSTTVAIRRGPTGTSDADSFRVLQPTAGAPVVAGGAMLIIATLAAGNNVSLEQKASNSAGAVEARWLKVLPVRVG